LTLRLAVCALKGKNRADSGEGDRVPKILALALIGLSTLPFPVLAEWSISAAAQARYDDNVGNAQNSDDKVSDESFGASLSAYQTMVLKDDDYTLSAGGDLSGEWFDHFDGLSNASLTASVSLKRKWGYGAFAPWGRAALSVGRSEFDDSYRDYTAYRAALATGKRLGERFNLWAEYSYEHRSARSGENVEPGISSDAFTLNGHRIAASLEYTASARISFNFGAFARRGDVVSTVQDDEGIYDRARAVEEDPALGDDAYAYRVLGNTYGVRIGAGYRLTEHSLIGCAYLRARTYASGAEYSRSTAEINWSYRY
jgi:hypothetical protein